MDLFIVSYFLNFVLDLTAGNFYWTSKHLQNKGKPGGHWTCCVGRQFRLIIHVRPVVYGSYCSLSIPHVTTVVSLCFVIDEYNSISQFIPRVFPAFTCLSCTGHTVRFLDKKWSKPENGDDTGRRRRLGGAPLDLPKIRRNPLIEILSVSTGCLNACTYCKTKHARGVLASYPIEELLSRAKSAFSGRSVFPHVSCLIIVWRNGKWHCKHYALESILKLFVLKRAFARRRRNHGSCLVYQFDSFMGWCTSWSTLHKLTGGPVLAPHR